jgi:hypothetical protein
MSTAKKIAIGTTIGAIIVGSGYVAYNVAANGITWTRDAMQGVIGGLGDAACWLAHGDHEECKDFVIQDVIVGVNERNETDNESFFKANIKGTGLRLSFGTLVGLPSLMMKALSWLRCSNRTIDAASCLNVSSSRLANLSYSDSGFPFIVRPSSISNIPSFLPNVCYNETSIKNSR